MVTVKGKLQQGNDSDGAEEVRALNAQPQSIIDHRSSLPPLNSLLLGLIIMGRTRQSEKGRRERSAIRKSRTSAGHSKVNVDWQCPYCSQWFSQRRNGPANHLRFCAAHRSHQKASSVHQSKHWNPSAHEPPVASSSTDSSNDTSSSSDSDSLSASSSASDAPVPHRRRAQKLRSPSVHESRESSCFERYGGIRSHVNSSIRTR